MNKTLHISASFDEPLLLESLVEKLADRHYDIGYSKAEVPKTLAAVETSSTDTYVTGTMNLAIDNTEEFHMPFITRFVFTCLKENDAAYHMEWSTSLN